VNQEDEDSRGDDAEAVLVAEDDLNAETVASEDEQVEADEQTGEPPPNDSSGSNHPLPVRQKVISAPNRTVP